MKIFESYMVSSAKSVEYNTYIHSSLYVGVEVFTIYEYYVLKIIVLP